MRKLLPSAALICLLVSDLRAQSAGSEVQAGLWRNARSCGLTALYLYAQAAGRADIDYEQVSQRLLVTQRGCTCEELAVAGRSLGLDIDVFRTSVEGLDKLAPPVLLYMADLTGQSDMGHFVFYVGKVENDEAERQVQVLDTVTAAYGTMTEDLFRRKWNGILLHGTGDCGLAGQVRELVFLGGGGLASGVLLALWVLRRKYGAK